MSKGASGRTGGAVGLRGGAVERSGEGTREWMRAAPPRSCRRPHRRRRASPVGVGRRLKPLHARERRDDRLLVEAVGQRRLEGPPRPLRVACHNEGVCKPVPRRRVLGRRVGRAPPVPHRAVGVRSGGARAGGAAATTSRARNTPGGREERRTAGARRRRVVAVGHGRQPRVDRANAQKGKHVGLDGGARRGGGPADGTAHAVTGARVTAGKGNGGRRCRGGSGTAAVAPSRLNSASTLRRIGKTAREAAAVDARGATFPEL